MCILFYGNCQLNAICQTLNLDQNRFSIFNIPCHNTNISKEDFTTILNQCDLIVTQSIKDNYRNIDYLSTSYVINNATRSTCNIIILDSCYFSFYHFDVEYKYFNIDKNGLKFVDDLVKVSKNNECNYLLNNTASQFLIKDKT